MDCIKGFNLFPMPFEVDSGTERQGELRAVPHVVHHPTFEVFEAEVEPRLFGSGDAAGDTSDAGDPVGGAVCTCGADSAASLGDGAALRIPAGVFLGLTNSFEGREAEPVTDGNACNRLLQLERLITQDDDYEFPTPSAEIYLNEFLSQLLRSCWSVHDAFHGEVQRFLDAQLAGRRLRSRAELERGLQRNAQQVASALNRAVSGEIDAYRRASVQQARPVVDWMSRLSLEDVDFDRGADEPRTICACDTFDGDSLADCSGVSRMGGVHYRMSCDIAADALQFPVRALNEVLFDADYDLALLPVGVTLPDGAGAAGLETFEEALRQVASGMVGVDGQPSFYESTYREYFDACRPTQCSWVAAETQGAASLVATLLGLFGGLVIVLRVLVSATVDFIYRYELKEERALREMVANGELEAVLPGRAPRIEPDSSAVGGDASTLR